MEKHSHWCKRCDPGEWEASRLIQVEGQSWIGCSTPRGFSLVYKVAFWCARGARATQAVWAHLVRAAPACRGAVSQRSHPFPQSLHFWSLHVCPCPGRKWNDLNREIQHRVWTATTKHVPKWLHSPSWWFDLWFVFCWAIFFARFISQGRLDAAV